MAFVLVVAFLGSAKFAVAMAEEPGRGEIPSM